MPKSSIPFIQYIKKIGLISAVKGTEQRILRYYIRFREENVEYANFYLLLSNKDLCLLN